MAEFQYRTNDNAAPVGKPSVYFTCHPADWDRAWEPISRDILKYSDCAVYYTPDMSAAYTEEQQLVDLASMKLFVIPVSMKLLTTPNRAMDTDLAYAKRTGICILPVLLEPELDALYALPENFGQLQYLDPMCADPTIIPYEEKLKKLLESVLISAEMTQRIRNAFDCYIFLSYRKKDRYYANELMRRIHGLPGCQNVAIWYDEFLNPGECFDIRIRQAMADSKLFALLVTPNLLEEPEGKPNFVMGEEYPHARTLGMKILPAEMVTTDRKYLEEKFAKIPDCVDPYNRVTLQAALKNIAANGHKNDPEHTFLMGLAYLEGVDMEIDRDRALALITEAGEAELPEAMEKLFTMYRDGITVAQDHAMAATWAARLLDCCLQVVGEEHKATIGAMRNLAQSLDSLGQYAQATELYEKAYTLSGQVFGDDHPNTLVCLGDLALSYRELGDQPRTLKLQRKLHACAAKTLGQTHPITVGAMAALAVTCLEGRNPWEALELSQQVCQLLQVQKGDTHPDTLTALGNLGSAYRDCEEFDRALEIQEAVYMRAREALGQSHSVTMAALSSLADTYAELQMYQKAITLGEQVYNLRRQALGENHPATLRSASNVALTYSESGQYEKARQLQEQVYRDYCGLLGQKHPDTLVVLRNLAVTFWNLGDLQAALVRMKQVFELRCQVLGPYHSDTVEAAEDLSYLKKKAEKKD